jgi:hypothetical protein
MTAPGHMSSTIRGDRHGVSAPNLLAQYPQLAHISRLSISPDNTLHRKLGLGDSLEGRDPLSAASDFSSNGNTLLVMSGSCGGLMDPGLRRGDD